jgi:hypothetical protein
VKALREAYETNADAFHLERDCISVKAASTMGLSGSDQKSPPMSIALPPSKLYGEFGLRPDRTKWHV